MEDAATPSFHTSRPAPDTLRIDLTGCWRMGMPIPSSGKVLGEDAAIRRIEFTSSNLKEWDSSLLVFLHRITVHSRSAAMELDGSGLPSGVQRMLALSAAVPPRKGAGKAARRENVFSQVGGVALGWVQSGKEALQFVGGLALSALRLLQGRARLRGADFWEAAQECGADALPIVSLVSVLVGLIMAFVGAIQLALFGAQIYVADLVGIVVAREMGVIMTGVIMAGRTGAAFAAKIGTMQTNEEIDALRTLGISPMDYLVLPRVAALVLMMPLLTLYADLMGLLGGLFVGVGMLNISFVQYLDQTKNALTITHFSIGLVKSVVFGFLVAVTGCMQGMRCGRSASDVGLATTSAVVIAIVGIIVADGLFAVLTDILGI